MKENKIPKCLNCKEQMVMVLYNEPREFIEKLVEEKKFFYRGLELKSEDRDSEDRIIYHCYNCDRSYSKNLEKYIIEKQVYYPYKEINDLVNEITNDIIKNLDEETIHDLKTNPEYNHFGFGLYIRNNYIYNNNKIKYRIEPDDFSKKIYNKILENLSK